MTTPTAPQLGTLNYSELGQPFNSVESKAGQNTNSLNFAYLGRPFVGAIQGGTPPVTYNTTQFFMVF
jgi:hypothetical protein